MRGINVRDVVEYVSLTEQHLLLDKETAEEVTVFELQYPDLKTMEQVENDSVRSESKGFKVHTVFTAGTQKKTMLKKCVRNYKNMFDHKGEPVQFKRQTDEDIEASLDIVPVEVRDELYNELTGNRRGNRALIEAAAEKGVRVSL